MKVLCTICARKGSKGIKNKNTKLLGSKPLIYYTINQAIKSKIFDKIVVSTDSKIISDLSKKYGAYSWFKRPTYLSNEKSPKLDAIRHAFLISEEHFNTHFDFLVDLDVTSPLRDVSDIINSFQIFKKSKSANLVTLCRSRKNPYFNMLEIKNNILTKVKKSKKDIFRRQDAPVVYEMNASIYIWTREAILSNNKIINKKTISYEMPYERSIDIDSKFDFEIVNYLMKKKC